MGITETEKAIENLDTAKLILCNHQMLTPEMCIRIGQAVTEAIALLKEYGAVVRCKDCKHRPIYPNAYGEEINGKWCYWCELHRAWKHDDWFCADGKRNIE